MNIVNTEPKGKKQRTWGWILAIIGGLLALSGTCMEVFVISSSGKVPAPSGDAYNNYWYRIGVKFGTYCIVPPFIFLGIVLLIISIWLIYRKGK
jgi:hypothetical protein